MALCYILTQSKSHSFLLERRIRGEGIECELTHMQQALTSDLCRTGIKFNESDLCRVKGIVGKSGLPECRIFCEVKGGTGTSYNEIFI